MAFRVQEFRSQMVYDGARPNLFNIEMTFPAIANVSGAQQKLTFMARAAQLPGSTVDQIQQFYFGRQVRFSGNRTFPEWTITIINDEDFVVRDAFEKWMSGLNSHVGNLRDPSMLSGDDGYQQDGYVTQFGKTGDAIKAYKFIGMFPIDLSAIDVDWSTNNTIEEFAVTLAYQWWEFDTGVNGPTTDTIGQNVPFSPHLPPIA